MIADESPPRTGSAQEDIPLSVANDNSDAARAVGDTRILVIARALGRLIAREHLAAVQAVNDNNIEDAP